MITAGHGRGVYISYHLIVYSFSISRSRKKKKKDDAQIRTRYSRNLLSFFFGRKGNVNTQESKDRRRWHMRRGPAPYLILWTVRPHTAQFRVDLSPPWQGPLIQGIPPSSLKHCIKVSINNQNIYPRFLHFLLQCLGTDDYTPFCHILKGSCGTGKWRQPLHYRIQGQGVYYPFFSLQVLLMQHFRDGRGI